MKPLTVYTYSNCDTCRRAVKWLRGRKVEFVEKPIRETPPSKAEFKEQLTAHGGEMRRLFNTSGRDYREGKWGDKLGDVSESEAFDALGKNGNLVKRPFAIGAGVALLGFDEKIWTAAFPQK